MRSSAPPLAAIFRSQFQGELLAMVLIDPDRFTISALARSLRAPVASVHREVTRLERAGLLVTTKIGRALMVAGDETNPAFKSLRELVMIAFGPRQVVAEEFANLTGVAKLLIFGSWAARYSGELGATPGDVDALVVGEPKRDELFEAAEPAESRLKQPVNATVVSPERWIASSEPFLREVQRRPLVDLTRASATE
jgi:predicted nucleotidyltransferase